MAQSRTDPCYAADATAVPDGRTICRQPIYYSRYESYPADDAPCTKSVRRIVFGDAGATDELESMMRFV